jgi:hypothetical protein
VFFVVSALATFLLTHESNVIALLLKSLFFFVPAMLLSGTFLAIRAHLKDFRKKNDRAEAAVIIFLGLSCAFYLLLIGLAARTFAQH